MKGKVTSARKIPNNIYLNIVLNGINVCKKNSVCRLFTKAGKVFLCSVNKRILYILSFACGALSMFLSVHILRFVLNRTPLLPIVSGLLLSALVVIVGYVLFKLMILILCAKFINKSKVHLNCDVDMCEYDEQSEDKRVYYMVFLGAGFLMNIWILIF